MLAAALLDLAWHTVSDDAAPTGGVRRFEAEALARAGVALHEVPPRCRAPASARASRAATAPATTTYVYESEILDADAAEWFAANGGLRRENGRAFKELLANGDGVDPMTTYRDFHGREPRIEPLLERRGLTAQE